MYLKGVKHPITKIFVFFFIFFKQYIFRIELIMEHILYFSIHYKKDIEGKKAKIIHWCDR